MTIHNQNDGPIIGANDSNSEWASFMSLYCTMSSGGSFREWEFTISENLLNTLNLK